MNNKITNRKINLNEVQMSTQLKSTSTREMEEKKDEKH